MPLAPGTRLGPYEIIADVGAGGMGVVYRARDPRLDRTVAIKVSHEQFTERVAREARAVAALNDPNICQIYDVGPDYLVMEYVEGTTPRKVDDPATLLEVARQLTEGLVAAHAAGIIHRDLKPGNILISTSGRVKILDFGLASLPRKPIGADDATAPASTYAGMMVGTLAYMSPEQARGDTVDARSDLWSLGVVLYEIATGVRPFEGATPATMFDAILNRAPMPLRELNPKIPPAFPAIVNRLLEKDRDLRYQSAADVLADLKRVGRGTLQTSPASPAPRRVLPRAIAALSAVAILAVAAYVAWQARQPRAPVTSPADYVQLTHFTDSATAPALSPDGRMVTFIRGGGWFLSQGQVYAKLLPNGEAVRLTNQPALKLGPVFTPDGTRVAYTLVDRNANPPAWDTWTVPVHGGEPARLMPNAAGLTWLDDRSVLFSEIRPPGLHMGIVTASLSRADHREIYYPAHERAMAHYSWPSPDRRWLLVVEMDRTTVWQRCRLVPFDGSSAGRAIGPDGACIAAGWSPDGRWMYFNAEVENALHLWRQRFPDGAPEQITFGPSEEEGLAVAPDGRSLVTSIGLRQSAIWVHDEGERPLTSEGFAFAPLLSHDGRRVYYLFRQTAGTSGALWSRDLESGTSQEVLPGVSMSDFDVSPDQTQVAFTTKTADGSSEVWLARLDRRSPPRSIARGADLVSFAGDDLAFRSLGEKSNSLELIEPDGTGRRRLGDFGVLSLVRPSPDGEWILTFLARGEDTLTVAVPIRGGSPVTICSSLCPASWSADGRFLYVATQFSGRTADSPMMGDPGRTLVIPIPPGRALPDLPADGISFDRAWPGPPGMEIVNRAIITPGPDPKTYVFVANSVQRNLFRLPLR